VAGPSASTARSLLREGEFVLDLGATSGQFGEPSLLTGRSLAFGAAERDGNAEAGRPLPPGTARTGSRRPPVQRTGPRALCAASVRKFMPP